MLGRNEENEVDKQFTWVLTNFLVGMWNFFQVLLQSEL